VMAKTGGRCVYCGGVANTIDHFIPWSNKEEKAQVNWMRNLLPACKPCNLHKGNRMPAEYRIVRPFFCDTHGTTFSIVRKPVLVLPGPSRSDAYVDLVRQLCEEIAKEKDFQKCQDLLYLLQAVIREDQEEIRIRMSVLAEKYPISGKVA
jgi:hypothetical protein